MAGHFLFVVTGSRRQRRVGVVRVTCAIEKAYQQIKCSSLGQRTKFTEQC
jgi:hypothetical protein